MALAFTLTAGNVNDCIQFEQVMARIRIPDAGPAVPGHGRGDNRFNKLEHNKVLATRYDVRARHHQALVTLACLRPSLP